MDTGHGKYLWSRRDLREEFSGIWAISLHSAWRQRTMPFSFSLWSYRAYSKALDPCFLCEWINECPSELETNSQHQQYPAGKPGFPDSTLPLQPLARVELLVSELPTWFWPTALFDLPVHCDSGWLFSGLLTASSIWR